MKENRHVGFALVFMIAVGLLIAPQPLRAEGDQEPEHSELGLGAEAFGYATGFTLYNVQMIVSMAADMSTTDVYTVEEISNILEEQKKLLEGFDSYVAEFLNVQPPLPDNDQETLKQIKSCIAKLNETTEALSAHIETPTEDSAQNFETKRQTSYAAIAELLGLKDE